MSEKKALTDQELAAEIVQLLREKAGNDYHAYAALAQAAIDYRGMVNLVQRGALISRLLRGGEL